MDASSEVDEAERAHMDRALAPVETQNPPRSLHRRSKTVLNEASPSSEAALVIQTLHARLQETEEHRRKDAEEYRALISEMATTCRTLQARIRALETERSCLEAEVRKKRNGPKRRTWQSPDYAATSPSTPISTAFNAISSSPVLRPCDREPNPCQCQKRLHDLGTTDSLLGAPTDISIRYDDEAFLWKAWSWY
ncbi:hypothetical protein EIP86_008585 [Pleurotus ostreatoroseus]|nr:hypothetical protein EIP86_008585 [Pleurotus ostreatoroseus]